MLNLQDFLAQHKTRLGSWLLWEPLHNWNMHLDLAGILDGLLVNRIVYCLSMSFLLLLQLDWTVLAKTIHVGQLLMEQRAVSLN